MKSYLLNTRAWLQGVSTGLLPAAAQGVAATGVGLGRGVHTGLLWAAASRAALGVGHLAPMEWTQGAVGGSRGLKISSKSSINKRNQKLKKTWKKKAQYKQKTSSCEPEPETLNSKMDIQARRISTPADPINPGGYPCGGVLRSRSQC